MNEPKEVKKGCTLISNYLKELDKRNKKQLKKVINKSHNSNNELIFIIQHADNLNTREEALNRLFGQTPSLDDLIETSKWVAGPLLEEVRNKIIKKIKTERIIIAKEQNRRWLKDIEIL